MKGMSIANGRGWIVQLYHPDRGRYSVDVVHSNGWSTFLGEAQTIEEAEKMVSDYLREHES